MLVLVSDGQPTDDVAKGLFTLMAQPWGKKAVRVAIAIGDDADLDTLQQFIGNHTVKPLQASSPESLVRYIRFVSTAVVQAASSPPTQTGEHGELTTNVPFPIYHEEESELVSATDVW